MELDNGQGGIHDPIQVDPTDDTTSKGILRVFDNKTTKDAVDVSEEERYGLKPAAEVVSEKATTLHQVAESEPERVKHEISDYGRTNFEIDANGSADSEKNAVTEHLKAHPLLTLASGISASPSLVPCFS